MGKIIGENESGIFNGQQVHELPIWIYWNTITQQKGYLKKENENEDWEVVSSIRGLEQPGSYNAFILDTVPKESSSESLASPKPKFIWTVAYWVGGGMINVIAESRYECFKLLKEAHTTSDDTNERIEEAVKQTEKKKLELKNNEPSRIFSFDLCS